MAIEARRRNLDTGLGQSQGEPERPGPGKESGPRERERDLTAIGESDHLIVLRDCRAAHMGKGVTVMRIRQRQPLRDNVGLDYKRQTFLAKISTGYIVSSARVSMADEPRCGKTARRDLCRGRRVTGVPTATLA